MADSPTPRLKLRNQTLASNTNVWGDPYLNNNYTAIDYAFSALPFAIGTATATTFSVTNYGTANQTQPIAIVFSGTGTHTCTVTMPLVSYYKKVVNQASGAVHLVGASGTGATIPAGATYDIVADGTNYSNATPPLDKWPAPTAMMNFGNQILGSAAPGTATSHGATLANRLDQFQPPTTNVAFGTQRITNLATPSASSDAATKGYVDTIITTQAGVPLGTGVGQIFTYSTAAGVGWSNAGTSSGQVANYTGSSVDWTNAPTGTGQVLVSNGSVGWVGSPTSAANVFGWNGTTGAYHTPATLNLGATTNTNTWARSQAGTVGIFTWSSNLLLDLGTAQHWFGTITSNGTIGRPTNVSPGLSGSIQFKMDTTGTRTMAFDTTFWKFAGSSSPTNTKTPSATDVLFFQTQQSGTAATANMQLGVGP